MKEKKKRSLLRRTVKLTSRKFGTFIVLLFTIISGLQTQQANKIDSLVFT